VGRKPRVGWAGGEQHQGDLELILPLVKATAQEFDWVFFGMCPKGLRPYVKEIHNGVPFMEYPAKLASLNLDVAVAPLEHNRFNVAKSNLRLLEYGIMGWPTICSDIEPYRNGNAPVVRVPNNPNAWIKAVREYAYDLDAAAAEGDKLKQWVLDNWMLSNHAEEWLAALMPH
jgi:glycosyltransferase involved in cell wall biosynthesis